MTQYQIFSGQWDELQSDAKTIREAVFIQEQNIPENEEWDAQDSVAMHFIVYDSNEDSRQPIATARLLENNSIGRVAVLKAYRGQRIGRLLMQKIINHAKTEKRVFLKLSSQVHAISFYESLGFHVEGTEYLDCGIPHIDMLKKLT